jgi:hypothetical protein
MMSKGTDDNRKFHSSVSILNLKRSYGSISSCLNVVLSNVNVIFVLMNIRKPLAYSEACGICSNVDKKPFS